MSRKRSRWWLIGGAVAGLAAAGAAGALFVKRVLAPGADEQALFEGGIETETGPSGTHPAAGSGTGWPEPQPPEHTEAIATAARPAGPSLPGGAEAVGAPIQEAPAAPAPPPPASTLTSEPPAPPAPAPTLAATTDLPTTPDLAPEPPPQPPATPITPPPPAAESRQPAPPAADEHDLSSRARASQPLPDGVPAPPSEPAVRPPVPFTEQQAEMNQRLQAHQDELLTAFPAMTRSDIVACDGDLARLAAAIAPRSGMDAGAVLARLQEILHAGPGEATNPDTLASRQAWPSGPEYVREEPEQRG